MFGDKPRGGSRGGKDRFNWDDVKNDEHRENYLGHSLHGQIGRWTTTARGSDLTWWSEGRSQLNRSEADEAKAKEEKQMVKEAEEDAMREAMGLEPIHRAKTINLEKHEIKALFDRGTQGTSERDTEAGERVEGMGFKPAWDHTIKPGGGSAADERMEGTGLEGGAEPGAAAEGGGGAEPRGSHEAALDRVLDAREGGEEGRRRERKEKKHKKEKKRKKEKKHKKKHKKEKKKRQRHDSSSDSDSEGYKKMKMNARGGLRNDGGDRGVTLDARALGLA